LRQVVGHSWSLPGWRRTGTQPARHGDTVPSAGWGKGVGQHLVIWCPAVAAAWTALAPGCGSVATPLVRADALGRDIIGDLLQQASFLHTSLIGKATMGWPAARDWLLRAVRCLGERDRRGDPEGAALLAGDQDAAEEEEVRGEEGTWTRRTSNCTSASCAGATVSGLRQQRADRCGLRGDGLSPTEMQAWVAATTSPVGAGARLAKLWCSHPRGHWPTRAPRWPAPRVVPAHRANAEWLVHRCNYCGRWACELRAQRHLGEGEAITVPWSGHITGLGAYATAYEITFDGASARIRGVRCAGAGAAIWRRADSGRLTLIVRAWLALPEGTTALVAEALACRLALQTLMTIGDGIRTARVMGDNPIIINHGSHNRNTRDPAITDILDGTLAAAAQAGWGLRWSWIERRANSTAHAVAKVGVRRARELYDTPGGPQQGRLTDLAPGGRAGRR